MVAPGSQRLIRQWQIEIRKHRGWNGIIIDVRIRNSHVPNFNDFDVIWAQEIHNVMTGHLKYSYCRVQLIVSCSREDLSIVRNLKKVWESNFEKVIDSWKLKKSSCVRKIQGLYDKQKTGQTISEICEHKTYVQYLKNILILGLINSPFDSNSRLAGANLPQTHPRAAPQSPLWQTSINILWI